MPVYLDQTGRKIVLDKTPQRIISVVPSQTELLYSLGLETKVVGITKFCTRPQNWFYNKSRIGGTKEIRRELVDQLQPDLIIANKEENVKEQIEYLATYYPIWISDVNNLDDACDMIEQIGLITGTNTPAKNMTGQIRERFTHLQPINYSLAAVPEAYNAQGRPKTCYLIWRNPYMTAGRDTFIHAMLEAAGFDNIFKQGLRYPEVTIQEIAMAGCEYLFLSSEPFPFKQKHADELQQLLPGTKIILVDGEMFSWYGSRLLEAPGYFQKLQRAMVNGER